MQDAILRLQAYWSARGCMVWRPHNSEVGAGTMNPATFLRVLGPEPWNVAYEEPSVRPDDSRYGENPNRVQQHTQFQVVLKPCPPNCQELLLGSYRALGVDVAAHDVRFVEDNWESPALGAWGLGYEVWLDGCEVTQYTFFQQAGGFAVEPVALEITYGLERILMALQGKTHFKDIAYAPGVTYGELFMQNEVEMSRYNLDEADVARHRALFESYEREAAALVERRLPVPAYNYVLRASHTFNVLDARGAIGVTERARYFHRMRALARQVAALWVARRDELGHPLLKERADGRGDLGDLGAVASAPPAPPAAARAGRARDAFVLEIGTEELPPDDIDAAVAQLRRNLLSLLRDARLADASPAAAATAAAAADVVVRATPRRLSVAVRDLATRQADQCVEVRGPPARVAYAEDGSPTAAAAGFCRKNGVELDATERRRTPQGEYLFAVRREAGRDAVDVLAEQLAPRVLGAFQFGKSMRWNASGVLFARPVRWLCAMLGDRVVPVRFAGLASGAVTYGLRVGEAGEARARTLAHAHEYDGVVADEFGIISDVAARRDEIARQAEALARHAGGRVADPDGAILREVAHLVEAPRAVMGAFDEQFLQLPPEVLTTVMHKHQRYFPVAAETTAAASAGDDDGNGPSSPLRLMNRFIAVANGTHIDEDAVRAGNEAVIRARYADAKFFYESDVAHSLESFKPRLRELMFQERLGSMWDKSARVEQLVPRVCELMRLPDEAASVARQAAALCKADLASQMVVEFTALAGTMGRHYAERQGLPRAVAQAIYESCLPRSAGDALPTSAAGAAVAVADRVDSLVGLFAVGLVPRSTADPFALRRAALGIVQTLAAIAVGGDDGDEQRRRVASLDVAEVVRAASALQPVPVREDVQLAVLDFVARRVEQWLLDERGGRHDFVRAVLRYHGSAPARASRVLADLERADADGRLQRALAAYARPARLIKKGDASGSGSDGDAAAVEPALFESELEHRLYDAVCGGGGGAEEARGVAQVVDALIAMHPAVDAFFDGVFVMCDDERVRANRLALCTRVAAVPDGVVDLTQLQGY